MTIKLFSVVIYGDYESQEEIEFTSRALAEEFCDCYNIDYSQITEHITTNEEIMQKAINTLIDKVSELEREVKDLRSRSYTHCVGPYV